MTTRHPPLIPPNPGNLHTHSSSNAFLTSSAKSETIKSRGQRWASMVCGSYVSTFNHICWCCVGLAFQHSTLIWWERDNVWRANLEWTKMMLFSSVFLCSLKEKKIWVGPTHFFFRPLYLYGEPNQTGEIGILSSVSLFLVSFLSKPLTPNTLLMNLRRKKRIRNDNYLKAINHSN